MGYFQDDIILMVGEESSGFFLFSFQNLSISDFNASSNLWYWVYGSMDFPSQTLYIGYSSENVSFIGVSMTSSDFYSVIPNSDRVPLNYQLSVGIWNGSQICKCEMQSVKFYFLPKLSSPIPSIDFMRKDPGNIHCLFIFKNIFYFIFFSNLLVPVALVYFNSTLTTTNSTLLTIPEILPKNNTLNESVGFIVFNFSINISVQIFK